MAAYTDGQHLRPALLFTSRSSNPSNTKCDQRHEEGLSSPTAHPTTSGKLGGKGDWWDVVPAMARGWEETRRGVTDQRHQESRLTMGFIKGLKFNWVIPHIPNLETKTTRLQRWQQVFSYSVKWDLDLYPQAHTNSFQMNAVKSLKLLDTISILFQK